MKQCVFVICLLRTIADYFFSWDFYYPPPDENDET